MSESPELLPVTEKKSSCGCHEHSDERLTLLEQSEGFARVEILRTA